MQIVRRTIILTKTIDDSVTKDIAIEMAAESPEDWTVQADDYTCSGLTIPASQFEEAEIADEQAKPDEDLSYQCHSCRGCFHFPPDEFTHEEVVASLRLHVTECVGKTNEPDHEIFEYFSAYTIP